jgi:uncharacterized protein
MPEMPSTYVADAVEFEDPVESTVTRASTPVDLPKLLRAFTEGFGAEHAIVAGRDGRLLSWSPGLDRTTGDQFAAIVSQLFSLASGVARDWAAKGACEHVVVRTGRGAMLVFPAGADARLAVVSRPDADLALVAGEARLLADCAAKVLTPRAREELQDAAAVAVLEGGRR